MARVGTGNPFLSRTSLHFLWISLTFHSRPDLCLHTDFCMRAFPSSPLQGCGSAPAKKTLAGSRHPSAQSRSNLCRETSSPEEPGFSRQRGGEHARVPRRWARRRAALRGCVANAQLPATRGIRVGLRVTGRQREKHWSS